MSMHGRRYMVAMRCVYIVVFVCVLCVYVCCVCRIFFWIFFPRCFFWGGTRVNLQMSNIPFFIPKFPKFVFFLFLLFFW